MKTFFVYSGLGVLLGISMILIIQASTPKADAQVSCGVYFCELLEQILQEEKKQTALLDHMDCVTFYQSGLSSRYTAEKHCGLPLDYTGVYKP